MSSRISIAGHPLHPMLVTIPIGLWVFSLVSDIAFLSTGDMRWESTAYFTLGGGVVGALLAAVPGLLDYLGLHEPRERRVASIHLVLNLAIVVVQAFNFWLRSEPGPGMGSRNLPILISIVAVAALVVSGWLGGQLVHVLGVTQPHHGEPGTIEHDQLHPRI
jgi:uncharacterized membrane protein